VACNVLTSVLVDVNIPQSAFFFERVRRNVRTVMCFSPVGNTFRTRCRRFPSLINCSSIDWFHAWPRDALVSVAASFLDEVDLGNDAIKENTPYHMVRLLW
jgi:dynein heavy chain